MNKAGCEIRMVRRGEIGEMLTFRNAGFWPVSREQWEAMGCVAVVVRKGEKLCGAIPLQFREHMINGRVSVPVVFENAVQVDKKMRSKGIGGAMLDEAERVLRNRIDAFCVYRGGERSDGYRFYRKAQHGDLYYVCWLRLERPKGENNGVEMLQAQEAVALERGLLAEFKRCYGGFGGYWRREKGYFEKILASHVYRSEDWRLFVQRRLKQVLGYAMVHGQDPMSEGFGIYDFAASTGAGQRALLGKIEWAARREKKRVAMLANREHPVFAPLLGRGYEATEYTPFTMGRIVRADRIFARLAGRSRLREELYLGAATPHRDVVLNRPARPKYWATLHLKESMLTRLLFCRLDMGNALRTNLIRLSPVPRGVETALGKVFEFCPWVYFGMDYV